MRFSLDHKRRTYERILKSASVQFRKNGPNGLSIADVMRDAGLTHGGFYSHFASRDELVRETLALAMEQIITWWTTFFSEEKTQNEGISGLIEAYLSKRHRDDPGRGCPIPAYGAEIGRSCSETRRLFSDKLEEMIDLLAGGIENGGEAARQRATAVIATMVGTVVLARATNDESLADNILEAGRMELIDSLIRGPASRTRASTARRKSPPSSKRRAG